MNRWTLCGMALVAVLAPLGAAQVPVAGQAIDVLGGPGHTYDHLWAPMHGPPSLTFSGNALFSMVTGTTPNHAGFRDAIRTCYGVDSTQGGHNDTGRTEVSWFRINQGWAPNNAFSGINTGSIAVMAGSDSGLGGDACYSPFFSFVGNTGGHRRGVRSNGGVFAGTAAAAFPVMWEIDFSWGPTAVRVANVIGTDLGDRGLPGLGLPPTGLHPAVRTGNPLLANVIFELQGPLNGEALGPKGEQYYLASTIEWVGLGTPGQTDSFFRPIGTGGVTNGNAALGSDFFAGALANVTNSVAHSRLFGFSLLPPSAAITPPPLLATPPGSSFMRAGRIEFCQALAFGTSFGLDDELDTSHCGPPGGDPLFETTWCSRFLWARSQSSSSTDAGLPVGGAVVPGAGGPDWRISSAPLSTIDLYVLDHAAGAIGNNNLHAKVPASYLTSASPPGTLPALGPPAAGFLGAISPTVPCVFGPSNRATFLWSATPNLSMLQGAMTNAWDSLRPGGAPFRPVKPGSQFLSPFFTETGTHMLPIIADAATSLFLSSALLTFGSAFTPSDDFFADGPIGSTTFFSSLFEGNYVPLTSGISELKPVGGGIPISKADPSLAGVNLYIAAATSYFDLCFDGGTLISVGVSNALTVTLQ